MPDAKCCGSSRSSISRANGWGIFALTNSLRVLQDFTSDPQILQAALQRFNPKPQEFAVVTRPTINASEAATAGATVTTLDPSVGPATGLATSGLGPGLTQAASMALRLRRSPAHLLPMPKNSAPCSPSGALNSLARMLGGLPGRKSIILGHGKPTVFPYSGKSQYERS